MMTSACPWTQFKHAIPHRRHHRRRPCRRICSLDAECSVSYYEAGRFKLLQTSEVCATYPVRGTTALEV